MSKYINIKICLAIALGISVMVWFLILWVTETKPDFNWDTFKHLLTVLTIDMILFGVFVKWIWKWKLLQGWLVPFPDLNGKWRGIINSMWVDQESGEKTETINVILFIKQTFLTISCVVKSDESESISYSASFLIHPETGRKQLIYCYFNKPRPSAREHSASHDGTALLNIIFTDKKIRLEGEYWTARGTTGELKFEKIE